MEFGGAWNTCRVQSMCRSFSFSNIQSRNGTQAVPYKMDEPYPIYLSEYFKSVELCFSQRIRVAFLS